MKYGFTALGVYDPTPTDDPARQVFIPASILTEVRRGGTTGSQTMPVEAGKGPMDLNALAKATAGLDKNILYILLGAFGLVAFLAARKK
jgi:hypothetical protein